MSDPRKLDFLELIIALALMIGASFLVLGLKPIFLDSRVAKSFPPQLIPAFQDLTVLIIAVTFLLRRNPPSKSDIGIQKGKFVKTLLSGGVGGVIIGLVQFPFKIITGEQKIPEEYTLDSETFGILWVFFLLFTLVIAIPILQEIFYRFYVYWGIRNRFGRFWAYLASSLLFSLGHASIGSPQILLFLVSSIMLVYLYEKTQSVGSCIMAHVLWNTIWFGAVYGFS